MKARPWLLLIVLLLTACAGGESTQTPHSPIPTPTSPSPEQLSLPSDATTAARIRARGYLIVGVRYDLEPFGFVTEEGELAGFDVDLGRELARRWLGDDQAVVFRQVRSDTAIEHLQAGDVDVAIAALTHTQEREAGADFSLLYFIDGRALLVRSADTSVIGSPADLEGRPVGVVEHSGAGEALQLATPFTATIQTYGRFHAAAEALGQGRVDAVADLRRRLFWGHRMLPETAIVGQHTSTPVAVAFPQNDPFFADLVTLTLQEMVADQTYADLYVRWFSPELPPTIEQWPGEEVPSLMDAPVTSEVPNTIATIQSHGRLAVAVVAERPPFAYTDPTGRPVGYEVNLAQLFAERWLGDSSLVDFIPTTFDAGKEMLHSGQVDLLLGGVPHTRAAELAIDFSQTTYLAGEGLMVRADTTVASVADLAGQQVAVIEGSGSGDLLLAAAQEAGVAVTVLPQASMGDAAALLEEGGVVAIASDRADLLGPAYGSQNLVVLPLRLTQVPLAIGLPPGDSAFRDLVNLTLQTMKAEGQFDALYNVWFEHLPPAIEIWPGAPYRSLDLTETAAP